jgi:hypothetical protein
MQFDFTIKITDIIMILALVAGPIAAVQIESFLRRKRALHERRVRIFRTLMSTRPSPLAVAHIEALNLLELEFHTPDSQDKKVLDSWKIYHLHLNSFYTYQPKEGWEQRRFDLLVDLIYEMGLAVGYSYDKATIKTGCYAPEGFRTVEMENTESRRLWLEILRGNRGLPMTPFQLAPAPPIQRSPPA